MIILSGKQSLVKVSQRPLAQVLERLSINSVYKPPVIVWFRYLIL